MNKDFPAASKRADKDNVKSEQSTMPRRFTRRVGDQASSSSNLWLVSFTDVMALMLTFFVLLFAMSNPKKEDWNKLTNNIQESFNRFYGQQLNRGSEEAINISKIDFGRALDLNYLRALIENLIEKEPSLSAAMLIDNDNSLIIALPQSLLFESGQAEVRSEANKALFTLATTLGRIKNRVEVVGHTDPRPMSGGAGRYPSNWELSLMRAANVAAVLENVGYNNPITIRGQASGRFDDMPNTIALETRLDVARRVDIVVMEDDAKRTKLFDIGLP